MLISTPLYSPQPFRVLVRLHFVEKMESVSPEITEEVQELKSQGNTAYSSGDYAQAIQYFTQALQLDPSNGTLYCNRSMAHSSLLQWEDALFDAKMVIFYHTSSSLSVMADMS